MGEGYAYMDVGVRATQDAKAEGGCEVAAIALSFIHPLGCWVKVVCAWRAGGVGC
jgi:hypothetical protein